MSMITPAPQSGLHEHPDPSAVYSTIVPAIAPSPSPEDENSDDDNAYDDEDDEYEDDPKDEPEDEVEDDDERQTTYTLDDLSTTAGLDFPDNLLMAERLLSFSRLPSGVNDEESRRGGGGGGDKMWRDKVFVVDPLGFDEKALGRVKADIEMSGGYIFHIGALPTGIDFAVDYELIPSKATKRTKMDHRNKTGFTPTPIPTRSNTDGASCLAPIDPARPIARVDTGWFYESKGMSYSLPLPSTSSSSSPRPRPCLSSAVSAGRHSPTDPTLPRHPDNGKRKRSDDGDSSENIRGGGRGGQRRRRATSLSEPVNQEKLWTLIGDMRPVDWSKEGPTKWMNDYQNRYKASDDPVRKDINKYFYNQHRFRIAEEIPDLKARLLPHRFKPRKSKSKLLSSSTNAVKEPSGWDMAKTTLIVNADDRRNTRLASPPPSTCLVGSTPLHCLDHDDDGHVRHQVLPPTPESNRSDYEQVGRPESENDDGDGDGDDNDDERTIRACSIPPSPSTFTEQYSWASSPDQSRVYSSLPDFDPRTSLVHLTAVLSCNPSRMGESCVLPLSWARMVLRTRADWAMSRRALLQEGVSDEDIRISKRFIALLPGSDPDPDPEPNADPDPALLTQGLGVIMNVETKTIVIIHPRSGQGYPIHPANSIRRALILLASVILDIPPSLEWAEEVLTIPGETDDDLDPAKLKLALITVSGLSRDRDRDDGNR